MRFLDTWVGLLATAVLGALVSSTAVTVSFGRMAKQGQASLPLLGAGISLAAGTMALRILFEVLVVILYLAIDFIFQERENREDLKPP